MSRFVQSSTPTNVDNVFALLSLVGNPQEYEKKMAALTEMESELTKKIELAGKAEEILTLRESTQECHEKAQQALDDAKNVLEKAASKAKQDGAQGDLLLQQKQQEAKNVVAQANSQAQKIIEKAQQDANNIIVKAKEKEAQINEAIEDERIKLNARFDELKEKTLINDGLAKDLEVAKRQYLSDLADLEKRKNHLVQDLKKFSAWQKDLSDLLQTEVLGKITDAFGNLQNSLS